MARRTQERTQEGFLKKNQLPVLKKDFCKNHFSPSSTQRISVKEINFASKAKEKRTMNDSDMTSR
jgi:hypothetical protein